jgi:hypothetical protein
MERWTDLGRGSVFLWVVWVVRQAEANWIRTTGWWSRWCEARGLEGKRDPDRDGWVGSWSLTSAE